jgi:hypothetical protein
MLIFRTWTLLHGVISCLALQHRLIIVISTGEGRVTPGARAIVTVTTRWRKTWQREFLYALRVYASKISRIEVWDCIWVLFLEESQKVLIAKLRELRWSLR